MKREEVGEKEGEERSEGEENRNEKVEKKENGG